MKTMILLSAGILVASATAAPAAPDGPGTARLAVGDRMPALAGDLLSGKRAVLPDAAAGRTALVTLGFSYQSRFQVEAWAEKFRSRYGTRTDVALFEVPMMGSAARLGRVFIDRGMRRNTPKELHDQVMTVYGGNDGWKTRVGFADPDAAYLLLIDGQGIVRWLAHGAPSEERLTELFALVDQISQPGIGRR